MRVTTQDSTRYVLHEPRIVTDSLVGRRGKDSVAVALPDVARVEVQRISPAKTAAVLLGVVVIGVGTFVWYGLCIADGRSGCNVGS